jgi:hypothetical protein
MHPQLSEYFVGAAGKTLSAVETSRQASNQHEFNGVKGLTELLGEPVDTQVIPTRFVSLDDEMAPTDAEGTLTWYDARRPAREQRGVMRWEYRLYYPDNPVMASAQAGDYLVLARRPDGPLVAIVSPGVSNVAAQLRSLFGLDDRGELFSVTAQPRDEELSLTAAALLEAIGIEVNWTDESRLEDLLLAFGRRFPATGAFSAHARARSAPVDPLGDPDTALLEWMTTEEVLFRTLERHLVTRELTAADGDVETILSVAQRAFQRRRARAGQALENHVEELLRTHQIPYTRGGVTEGTKRPDFLIPGADRYHDLSWPADRLMMLGAKTTCKDRWRQVLTEADRIPHKHLLTLEAPISPTQLDEMTAAHLTLVIPSGLHSAFPAADRDRLLSVAQAIQLAQRLASGAPA